MGSVVSDLIGTVGDGDIDDNARSYAAVSNGSDLWGGRGPTVRTVGYKYAVRSADLQTAGKTPRSLTQVKNRHIFPEYNGDVMNIFEGDPGKTANWRAAAHVERAPKKKNKDDNGGGGDPPA